MAMSEKRYSDKQTRTWFRGDRFFQHEGKWFFYTREGTMEGPFDDKYHAFERMERYVAAMTSGMLGILDENSAEWDVLPNKKCGS